MWLLLQMTAVMHDVLLTAADLETLILAKKRLLPLMNFIHEAMSLDSRCKNVSLISSYLSAWFPYFNDDVSLHS